MPPSKKQKMQRQKGKSKPKGARADVRSARSVRQRSGGVSGGAGITTSPSALTRSKGARNASPDRSTARRERASASANANSDNVARFKEQKSKGMASDASTEQKKPNDKGTPDKMLTGKTKKDFVSGRKLFGVEKDGKIQYLPSESQASEREKVLGLFVNDKQITKDAVNTLLVDEGGKNSFVRDTGGRTLFATVRDDGKIVYFPKQSNATAAELSQGNFVIDKDVEVDSIGNKVLDQKPKFDFGQNRNTFATETADGETVYFPKKSDANAIELNAGNYVDDDDINEKWEASKGGINFLDKAKPRYDISKGRKVYAVVDDTGKIIYLPSKSDASPVEAAKGLFINDDIINRYEIKRRHTALKDSSADNTMRRTKRAQRVYSRVTTVASDSPAEPVREAKDGTQLWDGSSVPEVSEIKQRQTLLKLKPKYDMGKGRMLYPTEITSGKIAYLPLEDDASNIERIKGLYAAFVPLEPLSTLIENNKLTRQKFETELGELQAYSQETIENAFEDAPTLVLRSARSFIDTAMKTVELKQILSDVVTGS